MTDPFVEIKIDRNRRQYTWGNTLLRPVTEMVNSLKPPFDRDYWSQRKATERGVSVAMILAEWEEKGRRSRDKGRMVHDHVEQTFRNEMAMAAAGVAVAAIDPILALNRPLLPEIAAFDSFWIGARQNLKADQVEWVVGDQDLALGGRVDVLLYSPPTGLYHIFDFKTGNFSKFSPYRKKLLIPFDNFDECELLTYSVQQSAYRLCIERNTDLALGGSYIVHLSEMGFEIVPCLDLRPEVEAWARLFPATERR